MEWAVVVTTFGVKPLYMILSGVVIWVLRGRREPDLAMIRWAFVAFLAGETMCALNYAFTIGFCDPLEVAHQAGMVGFGALLPWGLLRMLDRHVLRYSDPKAACAATRFCGECFKRDPVSCGAHRFLLFVVPCLAGLCLMPLFEPLRPLDTSFRIFWNDIPYTSNVFIQTVEFRVLPVAACALILASFLVLLRGREGQRPAALPFFLGFGCMVFAVPRFFLFMAYYPTRPWSDAWEEITEMMVVCAMLVLLHALRRPLGLSLPGRNEAVVADAGRE